MVTWLSFICGIFLGESCNKNFELTLKRRSLLLQEAFPEFKQKNYEDFFYDNYVETKTLLKEKRNPETTSENFQQLSQKEVYRRNIHKSFINFKEQAIYYMNHEYFFYNLTTFIKGISSIFIKKNIAKGSKKILKNILELQNDDWMKIIKSIQVNWVYYLLIDTIAWEVYLESIKKEPLPNLTGRKTNICEDFSTKLILLIFEVITALIANKNNYTDREKKTLLNYTKRYFCRKNYLESFQSNDFWAKNYLSIVAVFLNILEESTIFLQKNRSSTKYIFSDFFGEFVMQNGKMFQIGNNSKTLKEINVKINGKVTYATKIEALTWKKKFKINARSCDLMEKMFSIEYHSWAAITFLDNFELLSLPFLFKQHILELKNLSKMECEKKMIESNSILKNFCIKKQTLLPNNQINIKKNLAYLIQSEVQRRKMIGSYLRILKIWENFPLRFSHKFYKSLINFELLFDNYDSLSLTLEGFIEVLRSYYSSSTSSKAFIWFKRFVKEKLPFLQEKKRWKKLLIFFKKNPQNFKNLKNSFFYVSKLHMEIPYMEENKRSNINLKLESPLNEKIILGIIFGNQPLTKVATTKFLTKDNSFFENFVLNKFEIFYDKSINHKNKATFKFIKASSTWFSNYIFKCFSYSITEKSRIKLLINHWASDNKKPLSRNNWKALEEISKKLLNFIDFAFPGLESQLSFVFKAMKLMFQKRNFVSFQNLDGTVSKWPEKNCFNKTEKLKSFNPFNKKTILYETISFTQKEKINFNKHDFLSYLLQTLKKELEYYFIKKIKKKYRHTIIFSDDFILVHPNYVKFLSDEIVKFYSKSYLRNFILNSLFKHIRKFLDSNDKKILDELRKKFLQDFTNTTGLFSQ